MIATSYQVHCEHHGEPSKTMEVIAKSYFAKPGALTEFCTLELVLRPKPDASEHGVLIFLPLSIGGRLSAAVDAFNAAMRTEPEKPKLLAAGDGFPSDYECADGNCE